jgi:hypothetical protein
MQSGYRIHILQFDDLYCLQFESCQEQDIFLFFQLLSGAGTVLGNQDSKKSLGCVGCSNYTR